MRTLCRNISGLALLCFLAQSPTSALANKIDSLLLELEKVVEDTTRIKLLDDLSYELLYQNPDTAILISKESLILSEKIGHSLYSASCFLDIGVAHWVKGEYDQAIRYYQKAESIYKTAGHISKMIGAWVNLGIAYRAKGDYPRSLSYYLKSVPYVEEMEDKSRESSLCTNIGVLYRYMGKYDLALTYYSRAKKISEELGNECELVRSLHNIAHVFSFQGLKNKSIEMYLESITLSKSINYTVAQATSLYNLGSLYTGINKYLEALKSLQTSLQLFKKLGAKDGEAGVLIAICQAYLKLPGDSIQTQFDSLLNYSRKAEQISEESGNLEKLYLAREMLSQLYELKGDFKRSLEYYKEYTVVRDSMFNESKSKEIGKLEARHEFETAEADRKREEEVRIKQALDTRSRRDNLQYSGILIFLVIIFTSVFMLGKISIPIRLAEGLIFFSFLLFFEFSLVLLDPYIDTYSAGAPAIKLGFNAFIAALIFPLHSFFENRLKGRLITKSK